MRFPDQASTKIANDAELKIVVAADGSNTKLNGHLMNALRMASPGYCCRFSQASADRAKFRGNYSTAAGTHSPLLQLVENVARWGGFEPPAS